MLREWDLSDTCVQIIEGFLRELCAVIVRGGSDRGESRCKENEPAEASPSKCACSCSGERLRGAVAVSVGHEVGPREADLVLNSGQRVIAPVACSILDVLAMMKT